MLEIVYLAECGQIDGFQGFHLVRFGEHVSVSCHEPFFVDVRYQERDLFREGTADACSSVTDVVKRIVREYGSRVYFSPFGYFFG